jgi:D-alanyl-D-alanine carboxypeptidase
LLTASALMLVVDPAAAHTHHHRHAHSRHVGHLAHRDFSGVPSSPRFSAIVVDANSGRTIYSVDPDGLRHPASITKVMTLYLLFEQLAKGAITLDTRIPVSEHAAAQEPSKLGLQPGQTIRIEDAIKAVVTRSANDMAVAIAEAVGGDESTFAAMMTRKAHALGMVNTQYRNASGLPNDQQITTARDLTILARSLEDRFPRYFKYFSTEEFDYAGQTIGNHNHLLGRVDGVDGIKTGYTRASGFNLLTSVHRNGRSMLAVVMGGASAPARDRVMENLIDDHLAQCSTVRTATQVADASDDDQSAAAPEPTRPRPTAVAASVPTSVPSARQAAAPESEGDDADGDEQPSLRVSAIPANVRPHAPAVPLPPRPIPQSTASNDDRADDSVQTSRTASTPANLGWRKGPGAADKSKGPSGTTVARRAVTDSDDDQSAHDKGWIIQIGAADNAKKATALLDRARHHERTLADATPLTEKVRTGDGTLYRARFAGLEQASAESACRSLKRSGFSCFASRD